MAVNRMFGRTVQPACAHCLLGRPAPDNVMVLCKKHGPVSPHYKCRKYAYDPFKRVPKPRRALPDFEPADFEL